MPNHNTLESIAIEEEAIRFFPADVAIDNQPGSSLLKLAQLAGVPIYNTCNGVGTCGKCAVRVRGELSEMTKVERRFLTKDQVGQSFRLACQCEPRGPAAVEVPQFDLPQILSEGLKVQIPLQPSVRKDVVDLPPPTLADQRPDLQRLREALGANGLPATSEPGLLRSLSEAVREQDYVLTAVRAGGALITVELGDTSRALFGAAFDIGTTTVVGYLYDLNSGKLVAVASDLNPQIDYGADVISRICCTLEDPNGLVHLQRAIARRLTSLVEAMAKQAGVSTTSIYEVTLAGNTTMLHLVFGLSVANISRAPYIPVLTNSLNLRASEIGIRINPQGRAHCLPHVAAYVGADIVADAAACRLSRKRKPTLLLDIGTNGEIVIGYRGAMLAAATAAGPCFEGGNITFGMRASGGAIHGANVQNGDIVLEMLGDERPRGICGTGLIDIVAVLLNEGMIAESGRLLPLERSNCKRPRLLRRLRSGENGMEFVLVEANRSGIGADIVLSQRDIRELQNAKAAIFAGINILCGRIGIRPYELNEILLAGAFGNYISRKSAITVGLIPNLPLRKIRSVGNAAGVGASMALLSQRERTYAQRIADQVQYIELSGDPQFNNEYADAMTFGQADD